MTTVSWQKRWLGLGLIGLSGVFFFCMFLVGLLPLSLEARGGLALLCFILYQTSFWLGTLLVGKEVVKSWWTRWRKKHTEDEGTSAATPEETSKTSDRQTPQG